MSEKAVRRYGYDRATGQVTTRQATAAPQPAGQIDTARAARQLTHAQNIFHETMRPVFEAMLIRQKRRNDPRAIRPREVGRVLMDELRNVGLTAIAAGLGSVGRMTTDDTSRLDAWLDTQRDYMFRWVGQLDGTDPAQWPTLDALLNRADMYAQSAGQLVNLMQMRALAPTMPELPFMPKDRTLCKHNCKCGWGVPVVVDKARGDYDVKWMLDTSGEVEHCRTCLVRAAICNPLQIRGGVIVTDLSNPGLYA